MKKLALITIISIGVCGTACTSNNNDNNQKDSTMRTMDATGPMQDSVPDTTSIRQLPGDSVPMRNEEKK